MKRLIVGITGASGAIYGVRTLEILRGQADVETHLVVSPSGLRTLEEETGLGLARLRELADATHSYKDIGASLSSGSFRTCGMLVAPCSIRALSGIANCYDADLITRAADVCLKERRRVVLMLRETPFHAGHIELMAQATRNGAIIMPPVPAFYAQPKTLDDMVNQTVSRALDLFDIDVGIAKRWNGGQKFKVQQEVEKVQNVGDRT
ncbi:UbiX family flavin prenyltransferase [Paraburkholderia sp. Ac-20342]|uniref:UbiX family flavin prenyltransferase n=1 Tax=unclassified Paraburkholderia TaxID=2615204 RepID=UPI001423F943|nr:MULTISPECIES: UbiX family flavin prenyltransferase [unclassified Paraburkholderia]MBN3846688.1 UbiX family flavin prenyltransferase [Paraburkholderia sp. Ac-20342]NIF78454.1 UbiX family flavin prenyltransferase [Paraburkholderia sp. Cy-641]